MAEVQSPLGMDDEEFLKQDLSQLEEALIAQEAAQEETDQIDTSEEEQTSEENVPKCLQSQVLLLTLPFCPVGKWYYLTCK